MVDEPWEGTFSVRYEAGRGDAAHPRRQSFIALFRRGTHSTELAFELTLYNNISVPALCATPFRAACFGHVFFL